MKDGLRVASLDLDRNTRNLSGFLTLRRASRLQSPDHVMLDGHRKQDVRTNAKPKHSGRLEPLVRMAKMDGYDLLIIDTSSGNLADVYEAHLLADVILTPMNESPADMHGLFAPVGSAAAPKINYREMIETVRFDRKRAGLPVQRWHVVMNRVSALPSRVGAIINERVHAMAKEAGFEAVWSLRDRVVHRALALEGRTVFDTPGQRQADHERAGGPFGSPRAPVPARAGCLAADCQSRLILSCVSSSSHSPPGASPGIFLCAFARSGQGGNKRLGSVASLD